MINLLGKKILFTFVYPSGKGEHKGLVEVVEVSENGSITKIKDYSDVRRDGIFEVVQKDNMLKWNILNDDCFRIFEIQEDKSIHQLIKDNFPEAVFDGWATDLYVLYTPEIHKFCKKNYLFPNQITSFWGTDKRNWIEIPFQRDKNIK